MTPNELKMLLQRQAEIKDAVDRIETKIDTHGERLASCETRLDEADKSASRRALASQPGAINGKLIGIISALVAAISGLVAWASRSAP